jgi:hypothetical protein
MHGERSMMKDKPVRITEFFKVMWSLIKYSIASGIHIVTDSMKKEATTYKEEREQQKKIARRQRNRK